VPVRGVRSVIEVAEEYSILRVWVLSRSFFEGDTMVDVKRGRPRNQGVEGAGAAASAKRAEFVGDGKVCMRGRLGCGRGGKFDHLDGAVVK
jgi:hypothetical protein